MKRTAFTMLELLLVIVIIGILASLSIPRYDRDARQEAADNILSAIRYTQLLALTDNKHDINNPKWQRKFWKIQFTSSKDDVYNNFYTISSEIYGNNALSKGETAIDPANGKYMYNAGGATARIDADESPNIFIGKKYGINYVGYKGCWSKKGRISKYIGFDHLGRPHVRFWNSDTPDSKSYLYEDCTLMFKFSDPDIEELHIKISPETGYAEVVGQED